MNDDDNLYNEFGNEDTEGTPVFEPVPLNEFDPPSLGVIPTEQRIGQLFAMGEAIPEIVKLLQTEKYVETEEDAIALVQNVYASWKEIEEKSELDMIDTKNWHIYMRHQLLKKTMDSNPRAALAVLESLAELQKVKVALDASLDTIPIMINLVPRIDKPVEETKTETSANEDKQ